MSKKKGEKRALLHAAPAAPHPTTNHSSIPVASLSIWDPIYIGLDEFGDPVNLNLIYNNLLVGGEPGGGKSVLLNDIVGHAALSPDCKLYLFDGKRVELGLWEPVADVFVGPDIDDAVDHLRFLQDTLNERFTELGLSRRRKITQQDGKTVYIVVLDELAWYSATVGNEAQQKEFIRLVRGIVALGRAGGMPVVAATQRPTADIIPTSLRDIFGYRSAFRCTTDISSDVILGYGWAKEGYSAKNIAPEDRGISLLLSEGGIPRRYKTAYLTDEHIYSLVDMAAWIRHTHTGGRAA
jgi:S-DNA-T family DNA segregation ATPase FtsK/SpoIIIE